MSGMNMKKRKNLEYLLEYYVPTGIYLLKVNNRNIRTSTSQWRRSDIFIDNFEHISHLVLVFLLLTLNM